MHLRNLFPIPMNTTVSHRVLIGSAGTGAGYFAAVSLRRAWGETVEIVTMDINPRHLVTATLLANSFEQVPFTSSPEFRGRLQNIIARYEIDTYLPLLPEELILASELRDAGALPANLMVLAPLGTVTRVTCDKLASANWLEIENLPTPRTSPATAPFLAATYFLKPKTGSGSKGAKVVSAEDLAVMTHSEVEQAVVQEVCTGPEFTVDAFHDPLSDFTVAVCRERIEMKSGVTIKARIFHDETMAGMARDLATKLPLCGSFCFQVLKNQGKWRIIDINPRPGAATSMSHLTGNDFFAATFALHWGENYQKFFTPLIGETFVTRQYSDFVM